MSAEGDGETNGLSFSCFVDILTQKDVEEYVEGVFLTSGLLAFARKIG